MRKLLFVLFIFLSLCFSSIFSYAEKAPDFTLKDKDDVSYTLSEYLGTPIFLFYFEGDNDLSLLDKIFKEYHDKNIAFFAITNLERESWEFSDIPLLIDENGDFISDYEIKDDSVVILIDKKGFIKYKSEKPDELQIKSNLNAILGVTGVEGVTWGRIKSLYIH